MSALARFFSKTLLYPSLILGFVIGLPVYLLYISGLTDNPPGFFVDESAVSYTAWTLYLTGHSEFGPAWPLYFPIFPLTPPFYFLGYADPVQIYILAGLFHIFSPTFFLPRAVSATAMFLTAILLGVLAKRISGRTFIAIVVALAALATPWFFEVGRLAFSASLYPMMIAFLLLALYNASRRANWSLLDTVLIALALALSTYTYAIGRLLGPLLALGLIFFASDLKRLRSVILTWLAYGLTLVPMLVFHLRNPAALTGRFNMTVGYWAPGKGYWDLFTEFIPHFFANLDPVQMLFAGDPNNRHHVPRAAAVLAVPFLLSLIGILRLILKYRGYAWWRFVLFGLIASVIPASLTREDYHSLRLSAFPVFLFACLIPALMWFFESPTERGVGRFSGLRLSFPRPTRYALLMVLLIFTFIQAFFFQTWFRAIGPQRGGYFDYNFPAVFEAALEQPERPIYLVDQFYYHALWYSAVRGIDPANFVKLAPGERPPANSIVLSGEESHVDCIAKDIPFVLYKTVEGPPAMPVQKLPEELRSIGVSTSVPMPAFSRPLGITVDSQGYYYVADTGNSRIQKFDPEWKLVLTFGEPGEGEGQLREPEGVAVDAKGYLFVTDALNHKLLKFGPDGSFQNEWRGPDTGFYGPRDIQFGPDGMLYIVDQGRTRVVKFDSATEQFKVWGGVGADEGQFSDPSGIAVGDGMVFVADTGNGRIEVFSLDGKFIRQWPVPQWEKDVQFFTDLVYDAASKRLYVSSGKSKEILAFDATGKPLSGFKADAHPDLKSPGAMVIADDGLVRRLVVSNVGQGSLSFLELESKRKPQK